MTKKIFFTLMICFMMFSCGKKGDPVYKESNKSTSTKIIFLNKV